MVWPKNIKRCLRPQFTLRVLFIFMAFVAVGLAWTLHESKRQQQVFDELLKHNCVTDDDSMRPVWLPKCFDVWRLNRVRRVVVGNSWESEVPELAELINLESIDIEGQGVSNLSYLGTSKDVKYLRFRSITIAELPALNQWRQLEMLSVENSMVLRDVSALSGLINLNSLDLTNSEVADISVLATLPNLEMALLGQTNICDLSPLADLVKLRNLHLYLTPVVDLTPLAKLTQLEMLKLDSTQVEDLTGLEGLVRLEELELSHTKIYDLKPLARLTNLNTLSLGYTNVSDLTPLRNLTALKTLLLANSQVSNIEALKGLVNLRDLTLYETYVSKTDIAALRLALPNCNIDAYNLKTKVPAAE